MTLRMLVLNCLYLWAVSSVGVNAEKIEEAQVLKWLFRNYDRTISPFAPVTVDVGLHVHDLTNEVNNVMRMTVTLQQSWYDERFRYQELIRGSDTGSIPTRVLITNPELPWLPDTFVQNDLDPTTLKLDDDKQFLLEVRSDGWISASIRSQHRVRCVTTNAWNYPLDIIHCALKLGSFGHSSVQMLYRWKDEHAAIVVDGWNAKSAALSIGDFRLIETNASTADCTTASNDREIFSCVEARFVLNRFENRRQLFVLCCEPAVIVCLSWMAFLVRRWQTVGPLFLMVVVAVYCLLCTVVYCNYPMISGSLIETYYFGGLLLLFVELFTLVLMAFLELCIGAASADGSYSLTEEDKRSVARQASRKCAVCRLIFMVLCVLGFAAWQSLTWAVLANR